MTTKEELFELLKAHLKVIVTCGDLPGKVEVCLFFDGEQIDYDFDYVKGVE